MSVFVIADPGATWRIPGESWTRSNERLYRLVEAAADAGAQILKPQFMRADLTYPQGSAEHALIKQYELPEEWLPEIKRWCDEAGLEFAATVYHPSHVPLLDPLVKRWKIASFEAAHAELLDAVLATGKKVYVSLGMGQDVETRAADDAWAKGQLIPLHCVSSYPARPEQMNLRRVSLMGGWQKGLSDHSRGSTAAIMAVALGATVIEKHIKADDTPSDNPDYPHSASPAEFAEYVARIREAEAMLGDGIPGPQPGEATWWKYNPETGLRGTRA